MTMRAGSYDASGPPDWRGCIRNDSYGWFRCTHRRVHLSTQQARACAVQALPAIREAVDLTTTPATITKPLPEGWEVIP